MLGRLAEKSGAAGIESLLDSPELEVPEIHQVVVECRDASEQEELYKRMREEGRRCRVLTL